MAADLKRTPLYAAHAELGARLVDFAGWEMPVQYKLGIKKEHAAVRSAVGLFDVSHMGEVRLRGPSALADVQRIVTNDASKLPAVAAALAAARAPARAPARAQALATGPVAAMAPPFQTLALAVAEWRLRRLIFLENIQAIKHDVFCDGLFKIHVSR